MDKKVIKNFIFASSYQILALIVPLITTPYISRVLGVGNIGIFNYTQSVLSYFILFGDLGINLYGQKEISYYQNDKSKYSKIFWELFILRIITMVISLPVYFFMIVNSEYKSYYLIMIIQIVFSAFDISWLYGGLENFKITTIRNFFIKILGIIFIFIFVKSKDDLIIYVLCNALTIVFGNITLWIRLDKIVDTPKYLNIRPTKHIHFVIIMLIPQISVTIYKTIDKVMLGSLFNVIEVGYYSQADKILNLAIVMVSAIGIVMMPRISSLHSKEDDKNIFENMFGSFRLVYIIAFPMAFGLIAVADNFVPWFFGSEFIPVASIIKILALSIIIIGISNLLGKTYLIATNRVKVYTKSVVFGAIVNIILNLCTIRIYGAIGAAVSSLISQFLILIYQLMVLHKEINVMKFISLVKKYLLSSIIMLIVIKLIPDSGVDSITTISKISIGMIAYFICLCILRESIIISGIKKIKSIKNSN